MSGKKNSNSNGIHAQRLKAIRPYVNFNYDLRQPLTKHQKERIREYHKEITALTQRPYHVYRPRNKSNLNQAKEYAQHEKNLPGLKVAFIPTDGEMRPRISVSKKGRLTVKTRHVSTTHLQLNKRKLLKDAVKHVNSVIDQDKEAKRFTILAGKYEINKTFSRDRIGEGVAFYVNKYSEKGKNNYFGNWLHGLAAHHFTNQDDISEYMKAKTKAQDKLKKQRRAERAKAARIQRNKNI